MIELLSVVGGAVARLATEAIGIKKARDEADHELRMTKLQLDIDKARAEQQLDMVHAQAAAASDIAELQALMEASRSEGSRSSGVKWVDAMNQSVRPVMTYWWCLVIYSAAKALLAYSAADSGATLASMADVLVTDFDRAVIGSMISFWFVDRSLRKLGRPA